MLYEVLKEFVFVETGRIYAAGETLETASSVEGLIFRGFLRRAKPSKESEVKENPFPKELDALKDYEVNETKIIPPKVVTPKPKDLDDYKPQTILKKAKEKASKGIEEASKITKPKRPTKQKEMDVSMTSLVEEAVKVSKVPKEAKGV